MRSSAQLVAFIESGTRATLTTFEEGAERPGGPYHTTDGLPIFTTPSGNISCAIQADMNPDNNAVMCHITHFSYPAPPAQACTATTFRSNWVVVSEATGVSAGACIGGQVFAPVSHTLSYGTSIIDPPLGCRSDKRFLACANIANGQGFTLSRTALNKFGPAGGGGHDGGHPGADGYRTYTNARFSFSVAVPTNYLAQPPPEDGDGRKFESGDGSAQLSVYGANNVSRDTPASQLAARIRLVQNSGGRVTYRYQNDTAWICSGYTMDGSVFYEKQYVFSHVEYTIWWLYAAEFKSQVDPVVRHTVATFVPGPNSTA